MLGGCLVFVITNFSHDVCDVGWLLLCVVGKVDPHVKLCVVVYLFVLNRRSSFGSILNLLFIYRLVNVF